MQLYRLPADRVTVVPNGVADAFYDVALTKRLEDPPRAIYVGRLHDAKGIVEFTTAFTKTPHLSLELVIVGEGPEKPSLEALARLDPRIRVVGSVPHDGVLRWLQQTNIFVFPTYYEGSSLALLEAMASGHACVVRDIPIMGEVLGGQAGALCQNVHQMLDTLSDWIAHPQRRFQMQMAAHTQSRRFSWRQSADILMDLYARVACGDGSA